MLPELKEIADVIEANGYRLEDMGVEYIELAGDRFVSESHGTYLAGLYEIYLGDLKVGWIREENFLKTKHYAGKKSHHKSKGFVFLDTRGGRNYSQLKLLLEAHDVVIAGTVPSEEDLKDGRGTFVNPKEVVFNRFSK